MNIEELENEAEVCMHNALFWLKLPISKENVEKGSSYILKLLEPREKRIEELETQIKKMKCDVKQGQSYWNTCDMQYDLYQRLLDKWEIKENGV